MNIEGNKILMGSSYFFGQYDDYKIKDLDYIILVDKPEDFKNVKNVRIKNMSGHFDIFYWRRMTPNEWIKYQFDNCKENPMSCGKFLIPEFCKEIGFTIDNLKELEYFFNNMDQKHSYEKMIYDAYITNNDFVLSNEQRLEIYNKYKKDRYIKI